MRAALATAAVSATLLVASCASSSTGDSRSGDGGAPSITVAQATESPEESAPSALVDVRAAGLPEPTVDPEELVSGGPPPDGIPPIDEPRFHAAGDVDWLRDVEPVLALEIDGDARAYPVQVMIWHEIANDTVGGVPVSVTYCPLCNSAVAVDRRVGERTLSFGTSGLLYRSSLVMYDRQTESLWSHFTGEAVAGVLTGTRLATFPVATVSWADWREAHPDGLVLSRDTGVERDYGRNPYPGYDDVTNPPFLFRGETDDRLQAKERILGIALDGDPVAIRHEALLEAGVAPLVVDGRPAVAWALPGTVTALEGDQVDDGRDIGATGAFAAVLDGRTLTFERIDDGFVDQETSSTWNVLGTATAGPLRGNRLDPIEHVDTFWFAWAAFAPETTVVDPGR